MFRVLSRASVGLLAVAGVLILVLVREQTGTRGFFVGLGLAVLPVPPLLAVFHWLGRARPGPWPGHLFAFTWGACAAALIAIVANSFASRWMAAAGTDPHEADRLGSILVAPVVEELAKAAALLLVCLFSGPRFAGITDGIVVAGFTACGFAFTENVLYLGNAYVDDLASGAPLSDSLTAATFFVRVVLSPFAHPLFTVWTGLGLGWAAGAAGRRYRSLAPTAGLLLAVAVHALWNSSSEFGEHGFYLVYGTVMVPVFALLCGLAVRSRGGPDPVALLAAVLRRARARGAVAPAAPRATRSARVPRARTADPRSIRLPVLPDADGRP